MKCLLYLLFVVLLVTACRPSVHKSFEVSGKIENAPGKKLMLIETPLSNAQPVILDSTFLKTQGDFTLKGRATEEGIYRLMIDKGPDLIIINDGNDIKVHLDVNNYRSYTIEGSPASESLHTLFEDYHRKDSAIFTTFKKIDSLKALPEQDSVVELMQTQNDANIDGLNNLLKQYITTTPSAAAALYALGMASQTIPQPELVSMVNTASKKFPESSGLAKIKSQLAIKTAPQPTTEEPVTSDYALLNKPAPDLTMNDVNGKPISISSFRGKYVLVDFWASWCGPCRQENPNVVEAYNKFRNKNFTVLGVSLDQDKAAWQKAIAKDNLTWTHMSDLKQWESAAVQAYGFDGIPFNVLLDPSGKIIASSLRGSELEAKLAQVLQ